MTTLLQHLQATATAELCTSGDELCDVASYCNCDKPICPDHSDADGFVECAGNPNILHHDSCRFDCVECVGAGAEDALAGA